MYVESVKFSTPYYLHYPLLPTLSLLDHVKGLIAAYTTKSNSEEDIFVSAKLLLEEIKQLEDIGVIRECLCRLLTLEIEEIQNLIVEEVMPVFDFATFLYDIQHDQAQQLIDLEEIVSEIMEAKLKSNELNLIIPICSIYQSILEQLWLLPHFEFGNHCANLLIQNKNAILSHMERWKDSLNQLASEEKIDKSTPKNLEKAVQRIFEPLPEDMANEIDRQKFAIEESKTMTSRIFENMAKVYANQGDFQRAIICGEYILELLTCIPTEISQAKEFLVLTIWTQENLALWNKLLEQYPMAIHHTKKALLAAETLGDFYKVSIYLRNIGKLYLELGEGEQALSLYREARSIAQIVQDPKSKSQILIGLANDYLAIDKNEEAISCFQAALSLTEKKSEQTLIYNGIGRAYANAQQYKEAKKAYYKALEFLPQGDFFLAIEIHKNLAGLFNDFGRYGKAIFHAEKALNLSQHETIQKDELNALDSQFGTITLLGNIYGAIEDYGKGLKYHTQSLKIAEKIKPFTDYLGLAYTSLGIAYSNLKMYPESVEHYNKALEITKESFLRAKILLNLGNTFFSSGSFDKAIEKYKESYAIDNTNLKINYFNGLGVCYEAIGNKDEAIESIEKAICLSQESQDRRSEAGGYNNLGQVYSKSEPRLAEENYRKSINIYSLLHQKLKNYSQGQITFFKEQSIPLLKLESLFLQQGKTEEALQVTDFRRSRALVSALTEKFKFQKDSFLISSGLTAREMQALAHKMSTCLIVYSFASESTDSITAWIIPSDGEIICQQLPLGILTEEIKETHKFLQTFPFAVEERVIEESVDSFIEGLTRGEFNDSLNTKNLKPFKKHISLWYEALVAPLESYLPKDPQQVVTIIPDGYLAQIPFAAFLDKEGTYLIEKHPISIAPSIQVLTLLDQLPKVFPKNSLVIGNPTTSGSQLKFAEKEAQAIVAPLLETTQEKILLQDKATVYGVVGEMADARWIHLACHGSTGTKPDEKLDPHSVFEGLFKLTPDESHPQGYLHAQEIAALALRAELVFMSACFSGRGKPHGEGIVGPVWSFLAAGALSTIATYWQLPDTELTLQMVETFYRHFLGIGVKKLNKAQALQKAMLVGIEQVRERPDRWGAFFLSGLHE
ncbi:tetratricopeptide repeat protein [Candidatus Protochlamydia sp. W-9]|uniref:tetratricopeptide repeat protein n=1 Tax=Candidatus Protochlamydia sp. W-9 TaxID=1785087 RepID=UPI00096AAACE|nr:tetratricopeptide repeat protein [Candidatus Protochlamydia sp. W-9]